MVSECGNRNSPNHGSPLLPPAEDSQCHSQRSRCLTLSRKLIGQQVQWHPLLQSAPCRFLPEGHLGMRLTQNVLTTEQASNHCAHPAVILQAEAQSTALRRFQGRVTQRGSRVTLLREGQRAGSRLPLQHLLLLVKPGPRRHFIPTPHMTLCTITPETVFTDCYCISLNVT